LQEGRIGTEDERSRNSDKRKLEELKKQIGQAKKKYWERRHASMKTNGQK